MADARVERVSGERDACALERRPGLVDVGHAERDVRAMRSLEARSHVRRVDEIETDVAGLELGPRAARRVPPQPQGLLVELRRPLEISHGYRHEVGALDLDQTTEPSI